MGFGLEIRSMMYTAGDVINSDDAAANLLEFVIKDEIQKLCKQIFKFLWSYMWRKLYYFYEQ